LTKKQFKRDSILFKQDVISPSKYEASKNLLLGKKQVIENNNKSLINCELQIIKLEEQILDLELDYREKLTTLKNDIQQRIANLKNSIEKWEFNYLLESPTEGRIVFTRMWSANQSVSAGNTVFTIIPEVKSKLVGKLLLPVGGAGKVQVDQTVNIKLHSYPYKEYGMLSGKVHSISDIPVDSVYFVDITFPNGLVTNYKKNIHFSQGMTGQAEIVTENINLLTRIVQPLKAILKNNL
jgi:HlyD family secretion protein